MYKLKFQLTYVGTDKKRYQIEVAQGAAAKAGSEYKLEGARKGYKRFSTPETKVRWYIVIYTVNSLYLYSFDGLWYYGLVIDAKIRSQKIPTDRK